MNWDGKEIYYPFLCVVYFFFWLHIPRSLYASNMLEEKWKLLFQTLSLLSLQNPQTAFKSCKNLSHLHQQKEITYKLKFPILINYLWYQEPYI